MKKKAPLAPLNFAPPEVNVQHLSDGGMILRSAQQLQPYPDSLNEMLRHWAHEAPERIFLAERQPDGKWIELSYERTAAAVNAISQSLLDRGFLGRDFKPVSTVAILSDNGINNALLQLGAMQIGVPVVPVSPAYSLMSKDHGRLRYILERVSPSLVYAADGKKFEPALADVDTAGVEIVHSENPADNQRATLFTALTETASTDAVDEAFEHVGPDSVAKILFTSGSTGRPKGVINTQRMLCSNQQAIKQLWPFLEERPPVILDWLPWNHTFGGNHNFNMVLFNGGTLYIDNGKPAPGLVEHTVANLREVAPTLYFNVPRGFDMLLPYLEQDPALRDNFFSDLDILFYAGAALPHNLWERLEALSIRSRGERVRMVSAWGSTETSPLVTAVHFEIERAGVIGLPAPGCELKMVPNGDKLEMRIKGVNVTPGYWKDEALTRAAFDEDGFYCIGDAGKLADPDDPAKGIVFDGRVSEDFKLTTGTWVHVGALRIAAIAAGAPVIQDAVIAGHDRDELGLLVFPNPAGCKSLCPDAADDVPLKNLLARQEVRSRLKEGLRLYNKAHPGRSSRIARVVLMAEPPDIDANEITDKGYINQRAVLERRARLVEKLYAADPADDEVIVL